jgi:hypothetical protein
MDRFGPLKALDGNFTVDEISAISAKTWHGFLRQKTPADAE